MTKDKLSKEKYFGVVFFDGESSVELDFGKTSLKAVKEHLDGSKDDDCKYIEIKAYSDKYGDDLVNTYKYEFKNNKWNKL